MRGNLTVEGTIRNLEMSYGLYFLVLGNLVADNIDVAGSFFYVTGDCTVAHVFYGYYNDGSVHVGGETKAQFLISSGYHYFDLRSIHKDTITVNDYEDRGDFDYYAEDIPRVFVKEALNDDGDRIDIAKFIQRLTEGKAVTKPGAKPSRVIVEEQLAEMAQRGQDVTELLLEDKKLQQFPRSVLKIKTLKILDLSNNPIQKIPDEIAELENLEELYLKQCSLSELSESIGDLKSLRILDISSNNDDEGDGLHIPEGIGKLANLQILKMNYNKGFDAAEHIASLTGLEELEAYQCSDAAPIDFPAFICQLTGLKRLNIGSNSFKTIPDSFLNLVNLEELRLDSSLCYLNALPDLSRLPRLRVLHADGLISYTTRPYPQQSLLQSFFTITSLEELYIDRHNEEIDILKQAEMDELCRHLRHDPARLQDLFRRLGAGTVEPHPFYQSIWKYTARDPMTAEHLAGIGNLVNLRVLDLSFSDLAALPDEIFTLTNLQTIDLHYNRLPRSERQRLLRAFPDARIDLRNQKIDDAPSERTDLRADLKALVEVIENEAEQANEALATLASAADQEPENTAIWAAYGHALFRLHRYDDALGAFEHTITLAPDDADAWTGKGATLASLGRLDEAEAVFARTLDLNDRNVSAWFNRINAYVNQARYEEALATLQVALRTDKENANFWGIQGKALSESGRFNEALICLNRALELNPDLHPALRERGHLYAKMDRFEESVADFQRALELDDAASYDWHSLAYSLYKLGRYEDALPAIERAIQIDPSPAIVGTKGEILNGLSRYEEALDWLDRALASDPHDKEHQRERVVALRGLGRLAEADAAEAEMGGE